MCDMRNPPIKIVLEDGTVLENPYKGHISVVITGVKEPKRFQDFVDGPGVYGQNCIYACGSGYAYWDGSKWHEENNEYWSGNPKNGYKFFEGPKDHYSREESPKFEIIYDKDKNTYTHVEGLPAGGYLRKAWPSECSLCFKPKNDHKNIGESYFCRGGEDGFTGGQYTEKGIKQ